MISKYSWEKVVKNNKALYLIKNKETGIDELSTLFLKDMTLRNCSENTIMWSAKVMTFYLDYLRVLHLTPPEVIDLDYSKQLEHFSSYLDYVKLGRNKKEVKNNTANSYLQKVLIFYRFLHRTKNYPDLKIYDYKECHYASSVGTVVSTSVSTYSGYYQPNSNEYTIPSVSDIRRVLDACRSNRDKLLFTLMAETGIRIGEALGVRYPDDIDIEKRRIFIRYRSNNENNVFAKYAEERTVTFSPYTAHLLNAYISENAEFFF